MKRMIGLALALTSTVALIACDEGSTGTAGNGGEGGMGGAASGGSPSTTTSEDGPGPALTIEEYCEKRIALSAPWCDYVDECCVTADTDDVNFVPPVCSFGRETVAECASGFSDVLAAGATFDGTWGDACLAELAKTIPTAPTTCRGLDLGNWSVVGRELPDFSQIPACQNLLDGSKEQGEECDFTGECVDGLVCQTLTGEVGGEYVCLPPGTSGSKCVVDGQCEPGLKCVESLGESRCGNLATEGGECLTGSDCVDGLVCSARKCATPIPAGDPCELNEQCEFGYGCGLLTGTCIALGFAGDSCASSFECQGRCDSTTSECVDICGGTYF